MYHISRTQIIFPSFFFYKCSLSQIVLNQEPWADIPDCLVIMTVKEIDKFLNKNPQKPKFCMRKTQNRDVDLS